jgi:hypothetical protein
MEKRKKKLRAWLNSDYLLDFENTVFKQYDILWGVYPKFFRNTRLAIAMNRWHRD